MNKVFVGLLSLGCLTGCRHDAVKPPPTPVQRNANLQTALTVAPASPKELDPASFTVSLMDGDKRPVLGAQVVAALDMPTMEMDTTTVAFQDRGDGTYRGTGRFSMAGAWRVTVTATRSGQKAVQTFPITVR